MVPRAPPLTPLMPQHGCGPPSSSIIAGAAAAAADAGTGTGARAQRTRWRRPPRPLCTPPGPRPIACHRRGGPPAEGTTTSCAPRGAEGEEGAPWVGGGRFSGGGGGEHCGMWRRWEAQGEFWSIVGLGGVGHLVEILGCCRMEEDWVVFGGGIAGVFGVDRGGGVGAGGSWQGSRCTLGWEGLGEVGAASLRRGGGSKDVCAPPHRCRPTWRTPRVTTSVRRSGSSCGST